MKTIKTLIYFKNLMWFSILATFFLFLSYFLKPISIIGGIIFLLFSIILFFAVRDENSNKKKENEFRCCFDKCKFKNESLLNVLIHMEVKHKLEINQKEKKQ